MKTFAANTVRRGRWLLLSCIVVLLALGWAPGWAQAVAVDVGDASATVGQIGTSSITVDDVTGQGILSYELRLTWSSNFGSVVDAPEVGTLTQGWGPVTVNASPGEVRIVAAGNTPLVGAGTLIDLRFLMGPSTGGATLVLAEVIFNEGTPTATTTNGLLTSVALPTTFISPNTGEIVVGEELAFSTSSGVAPYSYSSSDPIVADFLAADNMLTGLAPGAVRCTSTDFVGTIDETNGDILVRALRLTAGSVSGGRGDVVLVPMTITDPSAFGIRSAEFTLGFSSTRLTALGVSTVGTLAEAAGWSTPSFSTKASSIQVAMSGANALAGPGVLAYVVLQVQATAGGGGTSLTPSGGLFNEIYPPLHTSGLFTVNIPPTLTISPDTASLEVGDTQSFTVFGTVTPPLTWGVTDPTVGTIDAAGVFTALGEGVTQITVFDDVGASDTSGIIEVCSLNMLAPTDTLFLSLPKLVPIRADRSFDGLGIFGYEITLDFDPNKVDVLGVTSVGTAAAAWGAPVINLQAGRIILVNAGPLALAGNLPLVFVEMQAKTALISSTSALTFAKMLFNEGTPCAHIINGLVSLPTAVPSTPMIRAKLGQNVPNPFNPSTQISYELGGPGWASLKLYSASGACVRTLVNAMHDREGPHVVQWNGRDDHGRRMASGVYYYRLHTEEGELARAMVLLK